MGKTYVLFCIAMLFAVSVLASGCLVSPGLNATKANETQAAPPAQPAETDILKEIEAIEKELAATNASGNVSGNASVSGNVSAPTISGNVSAPPTAEPNKSTQPGQTPPPQAAVPEGVNKTSLQKLEVNETGLVKLKLKTTDEDGDTLTYTFSPPLNESGEWQTNYSDAGEYVLMITADDGTQAARKYVLLVVHKKNVAPVLEPLGDLTVNEGEKVTVMPTVTDVNKDNVTITMSLPVGDDGEWLTGFQSAGEYNITVSAFDGEAIDEETFLLTVKDFNQPPNITGVNASIVVKEGDIISISPVATDPDGDEVKLSISNPVGDDGVWKTTYTDNGNYTVTITADDKKPNGKAAITIKITVEDVNRPPEIEDIFLE